MRGVGRVSDLVPAQCIERIVGTTRNHLTHYGRAVSDEQVVYILHSRKCLDSGIDLRRCRYSLALDRGIRREDWDGYEDVAVALAIRDGSLVPVSGTEVERSRA